MQEVASRFFPDIQAEVGLEKITHAQIHRGIRVDFYIPSKNLIIEVHGIQHFKPSSFGGGTTKVDASQKLNCQMNRDTKLRGICENFEVGYLQLDYDVHSSREEIIRALLVYI